MNSLVVLFYVVALAAAKPSGLLEAPVISYAAPAIASLPAAVSQQSRIDIKSSPAVVATAAVAPVVARSYIAEPALVAAPAAVSSQSRIDIKSSPAIINTVATAPIAYSAPIATAAIAPTVIKTAAAPLAYSAPVATAAFAPTLIKSAAFAAPAAVSSQSRIDIKSSPALINTVATAPLTYSSPIATAAIAPTLIKSATFGVPAIAASSAVSSQSRLDIKSSPAVINTVATAPLAYSAPIATAAIAPTFIKSAFAAPALAFNGFVKSAAIAAPALVKTASFATSGWTEPAAIVALTVPLDTPEVIAARAAHFEAKAAIAGSHLIHKRSAPLIASPVLSTYSAAPVISTYAAAPLISTYSAPLALSTPLITKTYSVHPW